MPETSRQPDPEECFCIDCRYPLRGLTAHVCPECGREFDPDNSTTFSQREMPWNRVLSPHAICTFFFSLPLGMLALDHHLRPALRHRRWYFDSLSVQLTALFALAIAVFIGCQILPKAQRSKSGVTFVAFALMILVSIWYYSDSYTSYVGLWNTAVAFYILCVCIAVVMISAIHTIMIDGWISKTIVGVALVIGTLGSRFLIDDLSFTEMNLLEYWTYWFWTPQRF